LYAAANSGTINVMKLTLSLVCLSNVVSILSFLLVQNYNFILIFKQKIILLYNISPFQLSSTVESNFKNQLRSRMKIKNLITLAWKALLLDKKRAMLTMLGIIIDISSVVLMVSMGQSSTAIMTDQFSGLGTNRKAGYGTIALSISLKGPFSPFSFCQHMAT
jgi:hypothetical protein